MMKLVRWMLLLLLPFFGWHVGLLLRPSAAPLWSKTSAMPVFCYLGFAQQERLVLAMECNDPFNPVVEALVGIELTTGEIVFRQELPLDLQAKKLPYRRIELSPDGRYLLMWGNTRSIYQYDWQANKIVNVYNTSHLGYTIDGVKMQNDVLVANKGSVPEKIYLIIWDAMEETKRDYVDDFGEQASGLEVNHDGTMAVINTQSNAVNTIAIVDLKKGEVIQRIPGYYQSAHWSSRGERLYLGMPGTSHHLWQCYTRQGDQFECTSSTPLAPMVSHSSTTPHHLLVSKWTGASPTRETLLSKIPTWAHPVFKSLWPLMPSTQVHELGTGTLLKTAFLPANSGATLVPTPDLNHYLLVDFGKLTCYPFHTPPIWPAWVGAAAGLILAMWLIRGELRKSKSARGNL